MTDEALVACFEAAEEPPGGFHHREHVRVVWWYLRQLPWTTALERFAAALRRYADARGATRLYHETITTAYVLMVNERLDEAARSLSWEEFAERNPDLLAWKPSLLDRYYRPETLASERARRTFVMPDQTRA
jgi:2'-5' RNA ligase